jgi:NADH-quinone oxidoreductase subunit G
LLTAWVATDPFTADFFFRTETGSPEEQRALEVLGPLMNPCLPQGQQVQLQIPPRPRVDRRGSVACRHGQRSGAVRRCGRSPVMPKLTVDGVEIEVPNGATVLQACELAGKEIPRFCYHERLSIAGNCRMCLVEVKPGPPKPQASCALPAAEGQEIRTDSPMVSTAREGVMEFLLINHPLDCPICDQGGECDLQDQAMAYGRGASRYDENKRAVTEKYMGPLIKTIMTRCIHCTRCVRFSEEIAGVDEIGALYRGEDMQITTYLEHAAKHELSANVIDLCPVGALTSAPYAYEARPWELKKTLSIDVSDAMGSNIRVDSRGREVLRVLPRTNDDVNEEWLSDKARYQVEGLTAAGSTRCGSGARASSSRRAGTRRSRRSPRPSPAAASRRSPATCSTARRCSRPRSCSPRSARRLIESRQGGMAYPADNLAAVNFNTTFAGIEDADAILIVGSHVRWEAPLVNVRLRKAASAGPRCSSSARTGRRPIRPSSSATMPRCSASCPALSPRRWPRPSARR